MGKKRLSLPCTPHTRPADPCGYAQRRLMPEQFTLLLDLVSSDKGLEWHHFDPKVRGPAAAGVA